jgi:hypothetical protein
MALAGCSVEPAEPDPGDENAAPFAQTVTYALDPTTATTAGLAQAWTGMFAGTSGWTGADGVYSIPLNGVRKLGTAYNNVVYSVFTFNDTFIGSVSQLGLRDPGYRFVNSTLAIFGGDARTPTAATDLKFKWRGDTTAPFDTSVANVITNASDGTVYWPNDGIVTSTATGKQYLQFAIKVAGLTPVGVSQLTWPFPSNANFAQTWPYRGTRDGGAPGDWYSSSDRYGQIPNLFRPDPDGSGPLGEIVMGSAILDLSSTTKAFSPTGYVYIYGVRGDSPSKKVVVARVSPANVSNPNVWQFYDVNQGWVQSSAGTDYAITHASPLRDVSNVELGHMAQELSVTQLPDGRLALVYLYDDMLGTQIQVRYANAPQGPWSAATTLYTVSIPNAGNPAFGLRNISSFSDWKYYVNGAKAHAQLSKAPTGPGTANAGKMLISFQINTVRATTGTTHQTNPVLIYGDIYRPRFITVDIVGR